MEDSSYGGGSGDSLIGLKFGKKIYFEDMGSGGSSSKSVSPPALPVVVHSQPPPPPPPVVKKGKGSAQGGGQPLPPSRCQVEGCDLDLTGVKSYYRRHKVCAMHSKYPKVMVAGLEQRFCQQCSRFHLLAEFDQGKRSCRRRLAGHNERRRKPPLNPLPSFYGRLSSVHGDSSRYRGILMDFMHPKPPDSARDVWPTMSSSGRAYPPLFAAPETAPGECFPGVSESTCALSLLSNQPWCAAPVTPRTDRFPATLRGNEFEMVRSSVAGGYMNGGSWVFQDHGGGSNSHGMGWREINGGGSC